MTENTPLVSLFVLYLGSEPMKHIFPSILVEEITLTFLFIWHPIKLVFKKYVTLNSPYFWVSNGALIVILSHESCHIGSLFPQETGRLNGCERKTHHKVKRGLLTYFFNENKLILTIWDTPLSLYLRYLWPSLQYKTNSNQVVRNLLHL